MIVLGPAALRHSERDFIQAAALRLAQKCGALREDWNGYNILHVAAGRVGALDVGFFPKEQGWGAEKMYEKAATGGLKFLYLLGEDETDISHLQSSNCFIVYQGHHGDKGAHRADVILPGAAYTEKVATYVNMEGKSQQTNQALLPPGDAKEDWKIIRALSEALKKTLPFNTLTQLQNLLPKFSHSTIFEPFKAPPSKNISKRFELAVTNYYMHDVISRHSANMASAIHEIQGGQRGII
jgi:NADH-quinone oxidoreductase subunit G